MILIDLTKPEQRIYLTLDGRAYNHALQIKNDQTRESFSILLPDDTSPSPARYNLFVFGTNDGALPVLKEGYYTYQATDINTDEVIESGKLRVIGVPYVADNLAPANINNTLIYKPNGE